MSTLPLIVTIIAGLAVLFLGRTLFWLFVAVAGFAAGFEAATDLLTGQPDWVILLVALLVGVGAALIAIFLRYLAVAVAGFGSGAYLATALLSAITLDAPAWDSPWIFWVFFIVGGVIGAALLVLLFDWALIGLSAVTGATLLTSLTDWPAIFQVLLFIALVVAGVTVQYYLMPPDEENKKRVVRRRREVRSG